MKLHSQPALPQSALLQSALPQSAPPNGPVALGVLCVAVSWPTVAQAELYKCTDGVATTYSSTACDKLGLKSAGEIRDRLTVIGSGQPAARTEAPKPAVPEDEEQRARKAAAAIKPVNPLVDRLLK